MLTTVWTAVFTLAGMRDTADEVKESINGLGGARLNGALAERLRVRGWAFGEAFPEDFGWLSETVIHHDGNDVTVDLVTSPEHKSTPDGGAVQDRWRASVSLDGASQNPSAQEQLKRLARDVHAACEELGATSITWEVGGP